MSFVSFILPCELSAPHPGCAEIFWRRLSRRSRSSEPCHSRSLGNRGRKLTSSRLLKVASTSGSSCNGRSPTRRKSQRMSRSGGMRKNWRRRSGRTGRLRRCDGSPKLLSPSTRPRPLTRARLRRQDFGAHKAVTSAQASTVRHIRYGPAATIALQMSVHDRQPASARCARSSCRQSRMRLPRPSRKRCWPGFRWRPRGRRPTLRLRSRRQRRGLRLSHAMPAMVRTRTMWSG